ncbi:MAG: SDR family oxidoreductase [Bradymonadaceae bacterium]|nr:SDR family oxidoreductase [Lujinxingiaceae bacterium]
MSISGLIKGSGASGFGWSSTAAGVTEGLDLTGRNILITGCNSGLGLETMRVLVERGATVFAAARSREKAEAAGAEVGGETIAVVCELSDPTSVRACVDEVRGHGRRLDAIICNAGIMALPERELLFGYEKQFFTNHVGHFILVTGLLDQLTDDGRVVVLSSDAHRTAPRAGIEFGNLTAEKSYGGWKAYSHSKLANLLFARELGRRFAEAGSKRTATAVHPGPIDTNLTRHMNAVARFTWTTLGPLFLKSVPEGAATQVWAAVHPDVARHNGEYLADCNVGKSTKNGADAEMARRLWEETERIVEQLA